LYHTMDWLRSVSKGDSLHLFWRLFRRRDRAKNHLSQRLLTFLLDRIAHRHGGYVGYRRRGA
ncbi:MAG: hypothetical protein OSJ51_12105, partial [Parabacteroides distasonis]|nr:hypothetical protein [Parabacteroides distasonis]